jgi:hypothetical protein
MKISGPKRNKARGNWYLSYSVPLVDANGAPVIRDGRVVLVRHRPHYASRDLAEADKPRLQGQYGTAGGGDFMHSREAQADYAAARKILPAGVTVTMAATYYLRHNPQGEVMTVEKARGQFLTQREQLVGKTRGYQDLDWRTAAFVKAFPGRAVASLTRGEAMTYLLGLPGTPRSKLNHKRALCTWGNWLIEAGLRPDNPFGGIKRKQLPKVLKKEIEFLPLARVEAYLRAAERYDPELVAHEVVQFFAGVRADDEMADFRGEWVLPATHEVVAPAEMTKTGQRAVIAGLEANFWAWWKAYGRGGLIRPANYKKRHWRIRILAQITDQAEADRLARLPIDSLLKEPQAPELLGKWPWNARRRTFCTYHVAKHRSAARTALILRHKGSEQMLHDSYRGTGVTVAQGKTYFTLEPRPVARPVRPKERRTSLDRQKA